MMIKDYEVCFMDVIWDKCKNLQKLNSIEIFYTTDIYNDEYYISIEYKFHKIDFYIFLQIIKMHKSSVNNCILFNNNNVIDNVEIEKIELYNEYKLISKDISLYSNINYIPHLQKNSWNNLNQSLMINTITGDPM